MIKLVAFDMDGVLTKCRSSWYYIHKYFGTDNSENIRLFNEGKIDYPTFMYLDTMLWKLKDKNLTREKLSTIFDKMELMKGAKETVQTLKSKGKILVVITGGLDILAEIVCKKLGIEIYYANGLETDEKGLITGKGIVRVDPYRKDLVLQELMKKYSIKREEVAAVGDGEVDIPMFRIAGLSIAFNPFTEDVRSNANIVINSDDLRTILNYIP
ncbi:MAG: HAD-IB family phosphatase [Thermoplasmata archaeon]|jgi:phosphoserine phosphatase|nr:HAD-IB family phosphatase [Thermoplasmata archaeon]MVT14025.1 HAD-IB family phosphatase [Euryarchaeota archaeon]MVT35816.1 HAD-IB family phosphatase [Euryarchaeota archaeon]